MINIQHTKLEAHVGEQLSMLKLKWILHFCPKRFYSGLHMTLERRDTKLWCMGLSQCLYSLPWRAEQTKICGNMESTSEHFSFTKETRISSPDSIIAANFYKVNRFRIH